MDFNYVSKMRYNKDKDLVFVTRPSKFWSEAEHVYEVHHLEQMVPSPVTAMKDMTSLHPNGILTVRCMATNENLKFYKDSKYWNNDVRDEFIKETSGLWLNNHSDKEGGRIFNSRTFDKDFANATQRMNKELEAAIEKHGKVVLPANTPVSYTHLTLPTTSRV